MHPVSTFGQETLSSIAATPGTAPIRETAIAYCSRDQPPTLTTSGTPSSVSRGRCSSQKRSSPGFARPIELTIPAGVSAIRTGGLPGTRVERHRLGDEGGQAERPGDQRIQRSRAVDQRVLEVDPAEGRAQVGAHARILSASSTGPSTHSRFQTPSICTAQP